jgi:hypothetical protein
MIQRYDLLPMNMKDHGVLIPVPGDELPMKGASRVQAISAMIPQSELPMVKDSTVLVPHAVPLELPMKGASSSRHHKEGSSGCQNNTRSQCST